MPNICYNNITITCDDETELNTLSDNELVREEGRDYNKEFFYYKNIIIKNKCPKGLKFQQMTPFKPEFDWLESLLTKYKNCWVKNEWWEESGTAGVWVGSFKNGKQSIFWDDLCIDAEYHTFKTNNKEL